MTFDVFRFQQRVLPVLLGWAAGSTVAGWFWWRSDSDWWRGLGQQFVGWGVIDGLIALFGLRSAVRDADRLESGAMRPAEVKTKARNFERILWINAVLDVGYILGGRWLAARFSDNETRRGMGAGIILQGLYLLVWDLILALVVRNRRHAG